MVRFAAVVFMFFVTGCASPPLTTGLPSGPIEMTFDYRGCVEDLSHGDSFETTVTRSDLGDTTIFRVRHAATCGLSVRAPAYALHDGELELSYEMYSQTGGVLMCDCAYHSTFKFTNLPDSVGTASFSPVADVR